MPPQVFLPPPTEPVHGATVVVQARAMAAFPPPVPSALRAVSLDERQRAHMADDIRDQLGGLLISLRLDLAWLDQRLAEQPGISVDEAQTMRMQMRMRCDGMGDQLERAVENLGRIVADLQNGTGGRADTAA